MRIGTQCSFLNFGYWDKNTDHPLRAQLNLTRKLAYFGSFCDSNILLDVGSGFSTPALTWLIDNSILKIICINTSGSQLHEVKGNLRGIKHNLYSELNFNLTHNIAKRLNLLESTSTALPIRSGSMDRIVAFESAQHFRPLTDFIGESYRVLKDTGLLVIAIPVITQESIFAKVTDVFNLGILKLTWASEHYRLDYVKNVLRLNGFTIQELQLIGSDVYTPLANYFIQHRDKLSKSITSQYPKFIESLLNKSILKMKFASERGLIDYALIKSIKTKQ